MSAQALRRCMPWLPALGLLLTAFVAGPAQANVELRVVAQPISSDIQAYVTVTDASGNPVPLLTAPAFTVRLDGGLVPVGFTKPPSDDPSLKVSVVLVMDYSSSVQNNFKVAMETAVTDFINAMKTGDFAAIIKFNNTHVPKATVVQPFTEIDGGAGTSDLIAAVNSAYPGSGTPLLDATNLAIDEFGLATLPPGPKSIIVITDGGENSSTTTQSAVVDNATGNSIPIFTIGVGDVAGVGGAALLTNLATQTGGDYFPAANDAAIAAAYATISELLGTEYLLTIPTGLAAGCGPYTLQVTVAGQATPASATFGRCDTTPDPFSFTNQSGVATGVTITSNSVTVSGITGPAQISVTGGEYSIGCSSVEFRSSDSLITNSETVCVRHTTSSAFSTATATTLTVGGVSGTFTTTTKAAPPKKSGGGGATGVVELLFAIGALLARRRRRG